MHETDTCHLNPIVTQLDKEKLCIRSIRGLNLTVVRPATVQVTVVSEW
jgi:hypothetical protein